MADTVPRIPGFLLLRRIGRGGMGEVWLGKQDGTGVPVAVKLMRDEESDVRRRQSEREAVASLNIRHENVVATLAIGRVDGRPWIAMEYASGGDLASRVREERPLAEAEALRAGLDAARGLREASRAGIVHRDVKPSNLLFDGQGRVRICDLGLVTEAGDAARKLALGTPGYMAPEQLDPDATIDLRTDMYSLGLTLFFAVAGRPPVAGRNAAAIARQCRSAPLPDPRKYAPELSDGFVNVLRRMTEKDPADRYQLWDELIIDLEHLARGDRPLSAAIAVMRKTSVRRRWLLPVAAAVLVLGGGAAVVFGTRPGGEAPPSSVDTTETEARMRRAFVEETFTGEERLREMRLLAKKYAGTQVAKEVEREIAGIEASRARELTEGIERIRAQVRACVGARDLESALLALVIAGELPRYDEMKTELAPLDGEVERLAEEIRVSAEREFSLRLEEADLEGARRAIDGTVVAGHGGLDRWHESARARLQEAERVAREVEARRARVAYTAAVPEALRAAAAGRTTEAESLLRKAVEGGGDRLGDLPGTDRKILGLVTFLRARAVRLGAELEGEMVALVREGELLVGPIASVTSDGVRLSGVESLIPLEALDAASVLVFGAGAPPEAAAAWALASGDARETESRLAGVDADLAARMRQLAATLPPPPSRPETPGIREGETPSSA
ncbi:MAG: protein kinase, partial [Planctomycetota bacterium]